MPDRTRIPINTRTYEEKYTRLRSEPSRRVSRSVLGTDLVNGYTTREQASLLLERLGLGAGDLLLDLGAGRAWPGSHLAASSACRLVSSDLPMEALVTARDALAAMSLAEPAMVLAADGSALPFRDGVFDAVVHADVLC